MGENVRGHEQHQRLLGHPPDVKLLSRAPSTRKLHDSFPSYPKAGISALLDVSNSITGMDPERVVTDHLLDWQHTEL